MKNIIGNPKQLGNLDIAEHDAENAMFWSDAKATCDAFGEGWRLPTKQELEDMIKHKRQLGGLSATNYWSSSEYGNNYAWTYSADFGTLVAKHKVGEANFRMVRLSR
jgi:hypothetical protein